MPAGYVVMTWRVHGGVVTLRNPQQEPCWVTVLIAYLKNLWSGNVGPPHEEPEITCLGVRIEFIRAEHDRVWLGNKALLELISHA